MTVIDKPNSTIQLQSTLLSNASQVFPWLAYLSPSEQDNFYADFFQALENALHEKNWSCFEQTIESWQATAEVLADSELTAILLAPSSDDDLEEWSDVETELFDTNS